MPRCTMWRSPAIFQEFLHQQHVLEYLYDAIQHDDLSRAVIIALDILKKTNNLPLLRRELKCNTKSSSFRQEGNNAYKRGKYQKALEYYNRALMFALKGSEEMVLAYSNRSALLAACKMLQACLNDIDTCFALGCPTQIVEKLSKRREEALKNLWIEKMASGVKFSEFAEEYLQFHERRNPQISCASTDVGVIVQYQVPKVVAIRDVKVGTVLAFEKAFISQLDRKLKYSACHYCHQMSLNLIPCEGCCNVLFCNKYCMRNCIVEYHGVECPIINIFDEIISVPVSKLAMTAAMKFRNQFKSWGEFNEATRNVGLKRMKVSEINDIFDVENKFSMLNFRDDAIFKYGSVYNAAFGCAILMHYLGHLSTFLPSMASEKSAAICSFCKLLMYFTINLTHTQISSAVTVLAHNKTEFCEVANFGVFPFTGKLKGACNPNVLVLGLNNKVALIAVQPLKAGMELTIAYLGHWMDNDLEKRLRWKNMLSLYGTVCSCAICNGDWELLQQIAKPTETHLRCLKKFDVKNALEKFCSKDIENLYPKCCKALAILSDLPYSNEYMDVYRLFRKCLLDIQNQYSSNIMLDGSNNEI